MKHLNLLFASFIGFFCLTFAQNPGIGPFSSYYPRVRTYYIAAIEVDWNYAPSGRDLVFNGTNNEFEEFSERLVYRKAVYREFTDASFTTMKNRTANETHLGILGPIIRGVEGDTIRVVFRNMASIPLTINGNGVQFTKAFEGVLYNDSTSVFEKQDDFISPGATFTYIWRATQFSSPGSNDPSSIVFFYYSNINKPVDANTGLIGAIIIARADWADPETARPIDVDREFVTLFRIFDEKMTFFTELNGVNVSDASESDEKHAINGYIFGNLPGLTMAVNERVRWYVLGSGNGGHTPHWLGHTLLWSGIRLNTIGLLPDEAKTATMDTRTPGVWLYHCAVDDHLLEGMTALYTVA